MKDESPMMNKFKMMMAFKKMMSAMKDDDSFMSKPMMTYDNMKSNYNNKFGDMMEKKIRQMSGDVHADGYKIWKKVFFILAIPVIILGHVNAFGMSDGSEHVPPPFVPYDHLRIRTKKFPWGDGNHSLVHNSHLNALPDGYEHHDDE